MCFSKNTRRPPCISWFKRRKPGLFGYIIVFLLITSLTGCDDTIWIWDSKETQKAKQAKFEQERNKEMKLALSKFEYLFKNESDEFIALLSIKYTLNIDLTHKIIDEFVQKDLSISDIETISDIKSIEGLEKVKNENKKPKVEERIKKISTDNNVEQSLIASLLIDYKIWDEAQHSETH